MKLIRLLTVSNIFALEVVQSCQHCQLCVLQENSNTLSILAKGACLAVNAQRIYNGSAAVDPGREHRDQEILRVVPYPPGPYPPGTTKADGTHPAGMLSCLYHKKTIRQIF